VSVVLDTNVVMSGLFFGGGPCQILEAWHHGGFEWVVSEPVLTE
jgi:predicted nucleic acid-binding protein